MRRGDPERIYQAHRAGIFARLTQNEGVDELDAEHWISRWERDAEAQGLARDHGRLLGDCLGLDRGTTKRPSDAAARLTGRGRDRASARGAGVS